MISPYVSLVYAMNERSPDQMLTRAKRTNIAEAKNNVFAKSDFSESYN